MSLEELKGALADALAKIEAIQTQILELGDKYAGGELTYAEYRAQMTVLAAKKAAVTAIIVDLRARIAAFAAPPPAAAEPMEPEVPAAPEVPVVPPGDEEAKRKAVEAADLYAQADILHQKLKLGQVTESSFAAQIAGINARLAALDWPAWVMPAAPPPPPAPAVAPAVSLNLDPMTDLMRAYGFVAPMQETPELAASMVSIADDILIRAGVNPQAIAEAARSPMDPGTAATLATAVALGCVTAVGALGAVGIAAESLSLGQLETVMTSVMKIVDAMGVSQLGANAAMMPWELGVLEPARQYWLSVHQPSLPGAGDLIRFVVKEAITPDRFEELMKLQGFRDEFTSAYWAAHWRDLSAEQAHEAMHKGIITREERDKYLVLLDYKPEPRPGITTADRDIIAGLAKTPLPRVDVRRGFKLGEISMERMEKEYVGLGYEDNAPLMTKIQARAAYESLQNSVINEAMYMLSAGKITDADFEGIFDQVRETYDEKTLWITRAQLRKVRMAKPPAEEGAPPPSETELEEKLE